MKLLKKISVWYYVGILIWVIIIILRKFGIIIPVVNDYLTDLYTIPMYCYTIEFLMNEIFLYHWKPDLKFVMTSLIYITLIFEIIGPRLSVEFTADPIDFICYLVGALIYLAYNNYRYRSN